MFLHVFSGTPGSESQTFLCRVLQNLLHGLNVLTLTCRPGSMHDMQSVKVYLYLLLLDLDSLYDFTSPHPKGLVKICVRCENLFLLL